MGLINKLIKLIIKPTPRLDLFYAGLLIAVPIIAPLPSLAQSTAPDAQGNYFSNYAPLQAPQSPSRKQAGSLWQVQVAWLNCRSDASMNSPVVKVFAESTLLEAEVFYGGADEVLINRLDEQGDPWMHVRGKDFNSGCFVRANSRFIRPATSR
ncbi:MAG: hypothetical protein NW214_10305 [Pseudanabaenaceae cyanobacterium bins.39]|nr:hypothetical protein [Pseudanabaenaceae cyanobacterium bins.39]